MVLYIQ